MNTRKLWKYKQSFIFLVVHLIKCGYHVRRKVKFYEKILSVQLQLRYVCTNSDRLIKNGNGCSNLFPAKCMNRRKSKRPFSLHWILIRKIFIGWPSVYGEVITKGNGKEKDLVVTNGFEIKNFNKVTWLLIILSLSNICILTSLFSVMVNNLIFTPTDKYYSFLPKMELFNQICGLVEHLQKHSLKKRKIRTKFSFLEEGCRWFNHNQPSCQ